MAESTATANNRVAFIILPNTTGALSDICKKLRLKTKESCSNDSNEFNANILQNINRSSNTSNTSNTQYTHVLIDVEKNNNDHKKILQKNAETENIVVNNDTYKKILKQATNIDIYEPPEISTGNPIIPHADRAALLVKILTHEDIINKQPGIEKCFNVITYSTYTELQKYLQDGGNIPEPILKQLHNKIIEGNIINTLCEYIKSNKNYIYKDEQHNLYEVLDNIKQYDPLNLKCGANDILYRKDVLDYLLDIIIKLLAIIEEKKTKLKNVIRKKQEKIIKKQYILLQYYLELFKAKIQKIYKYCPDEFYNSKIERPQIISPRNTGVAGTDIGPGNTEGDSGEAAGSETAGSVEDGTDNFTPPINSRTKKSRSRYLNPVNWLNWLNWLRRVKKTKKKKRAADADASGDGSAAASGEGEDGGAASAASGEGEDGEGASAAASAGAAASDASGEDGSEGEGEGEGEDGSDASGEAANAAGSDASGEAASAAASDASDNNFIGEILANPLQSNTSEDNEKLMANFEALFEANEGAAHSSLALAAAASANTTHIVESINKEYNILHTWYKSNISTTTYNHTNIEKMFRYLFEFNNLLTNFKKNTTNVSNTKNIMELYSRLLALCILFVKHIGKCIQFVSKTHNKKIQYLKNLNQKKTILEKIIKRYKEILTESNV